MEYENKKFKENFEILDNHCHVCFSLPIDETLEGFRKYTTELGISKIGILSCPATDHAAKEVDVLENLEALYIKDKLGIPVYTYASFMHHFDDPEKYELLGKTMLEMGFDGFKSLDMHPRNRKKAGKGLNHPSFKLFFDNLEETETPMVCHVGDPAASWDVEDAKRRGLPLSRIYDATFPTLQQLYDEMEDLFKMHPKAKIILAHFYFKSDNYDDLVRLLETYPAICLDFTPGSEMFRGFSKNMELWREFMIKYQDRLVLGSDLYGAGYGISRHKLVRAYFEGTEPFGIRDDEDIVIPMNLPDEVLEKIYSKNIIRLIGHEPNKINYKLACDYCKYVEENNIDELDEIGKENLKVITEYFKSKI